jgi:hypothetical protein
MVRLVQLKQLSGINGYQFGIFQHLDGFSARPSREKAFISDHQLTFDCETFRDVRFVFVVVNPRNAFVDEIDGATGMADGLQVPIFLHHPDGAYRLER